MGCVYDSAIYFSTLYVIVVMEEFSREDKDKNQLGFGILTFSPELKAMALFVVIFDIKSCDHRIF